MTSKTLTASDPHEWVSKRKVPTTDKVELPKLLIDEVIGQDEAVATAKKAARQGRHLLLLGDPGTGKSMIAKAMAQIGTRDGAVIRDVEALTIEALEEAEIVFADLPMSA